MLRMPTRHVTATAQSNLDRFRTTSAAKDLDEDTFAWTVVEWSWTQGPPLHVNVRSEAGEVRDFLMDEEGVWRVQCDPNVPVDPAATVKRA